MTQKRRMNATKRKDVEFGALIRERDQFCRRCGGNEVLQVAHVVSRRYHVTRHDPENAVLLCRACHMWQTHHPIEGDLFFDELLGEGHVLRMKHRAIGLPLGDTE